MKKVVILLLLFLICFWDMVQCQTINHWETAVFKNDIWRYFVGTSEPDANWRSYSFNDTGWPHGPGGFGFSDNTSNIFRPAPVWFTPPFDFTSSNLPIVVITTRPGETIKNEPKITADMKIIHNGGSIINNISDAGNVYSGKIGIEIRGHYSASLPQKPYGIETRDASGNNLDISPLGMPAENDWVLLANYNDKTFLRNVLAFDFFEKMGHYATRTRYCEVVLNSEYQGIYLFGEKIKRDNNRVDISKITTDDNTGDNLTGGYIFKNDYYVATESWLSNFSPINKPGAKVYFVYYDPKPEELTEQQKSYIQGFVNSLETTLYSSNFKNPATGYKAYLDVQSFVDYFIIGEVTRNVDAYKKSRFFYKNKDSKDGLLYSGPVWDFDWAWKNLKENCIHFNQTDGSGWAYKVNECSASPVPPSWEVRLLQDNEFANLIHARYFALRKTILSQARIDHSIDSVVTLIDEAQKRHFQKWKILGINVGTPESDAQPSTFSGEIEKFKNWISTRLAWLDANMVGSASSININGPMVPAKCRVFPNPVSDILYVESDKEIKNFALYNIVGIMVEERINCYNFSVTTNVAHLHPGIYLAKIQFSSGEIITTKVVKK
jgi:hypothetical protein